MTRRLALLLAVSLGACAGSGTARVDYGASVTVRSPELVSVDADVYTLADSDEPVFYTDNYYWLYRDDRWYRSNHYDRDWVYVSQPAPRLRHIERPTAYIRYRSTRQEARNTVPAPRHDDDYDRRPFQPTSPAQPPTPYPPPPRQSPTESPRDIPREHDHDRDHRGDRELDRNVRPNPPGNARSDERRGNPPHEKQNKQNAKNDNDRKDKKDKKHDH